MQLHHFSIPVLSSSPHHVPTSLFPLKFMTHFSLIIITYMSLITSLFIGEVCCGLRFPLLCQHVQAAIQQRYLGVSIPVFSRGNLMPQNTIRQQTFQSFDSCNLSAPTSIKSPENQLQELCLDLFSRAGYPPNQSISEF